MFLDNVIRNDKLTTPTDMFDAYDEYKKDFAVSEDEAPTWFYEDREVPDNPPTPVNEAAKLNIQTEMGKWFELYSQLHDKDNLTIYPTIVNNDTKENIDNGVVFQGMVMFVNGMNGCTRYSKQSLQHVMDFITFVEDHLGGRACIESTSYHSDVYYYVIHIIIWDDTLEPVSAQANCRPLFWEK